MSFVRVMGAPTVKVPSAPVVPLVRIAPLPCTHVFVYGPPKVVLQFVAVVFHVFVVPAIRPYMSAACATPVIIHAIDSMTATIVIRFVVFM